MLSFSLVLALTLNAIGLVAPESVDSDFCKLTGFKFDANAGNGTGTIIAGPGGCDAVSMESAPNDSMAASFRSPRLTVIPGRRLNTTFMIRTEALEPIPGGLENGAPALTGGVYLHFFDSNGDSGAWNPQMGTLAPANTGGEWVQRSVTFVVPTTATTVDVHLAYAAHTFKYEPNRMLGGRAFGRAAIGSIVIADVGAAPAPASSIRVPDDTLQGALNQAFACLHNSQQSGNFTVGAGYTISGNISPDLSFVLFGVRRTDRSDWMEQYARQWQWHAPDTKSGEYIVGRVMGQVLWPLGVDTIFSFTGDVAYLEKALPLADLSLAFVNSRTDADGLATLVKVGQGHIGGGADWVDWWTPRLQGRTLMFHMWYARAMRRLAELHAEFAASFGNTTLASAYRKRVEALERTLREKFWLGTHWLTPVELRAFLGAGYQ